jgi:hypothetical protein
MPVGTPIQVRLQDEELQALDGYRREKLNPPSRSRALRELANFALVSSEARVAFRSLPQSAVAAAGPSKRSRGS